MSEEGFPTDFADLESDESNDAYVDMIFEKPPKSPAPKSPPKEQPAPKDHDFSEDFYNRQEAARKSQVEARREKPNNFTFKPESFTSPRGKKAPPPEPQRKSPAPAATFRKPKKAATNQENTQELPPRMQEIYNESLRANQPPPPPPKVFTMRRPSESTTQIARDRASCMIDSLVGPEQQLSENRLRVLLRRFAILEAGVVKKVEDAVRISDDSFDAERLKALFVGAVNETDKSNLARRIKPSIVAALSNMKPVVIYTRAKAPPRPQQHTQRPPSSASEHEPQQLRVSRSSESYDASETAARKEPYQPKKKKVTPKKTKPTGAKYFPGFYDNIDFYANNPKSVPHN